MSSNKKTITNVICSVMVLATNVVISFFLSPYIVKHIGVEANGFVTLANNFVSYAALIVAALNSMAARYITLSYVKKDYDKANLYYNSVFWGNLLIVAILILPATFFIVCMECLVDVPNNIVWDVKLLFSFVFFNFFLTTGLPNWDCGTYVSNRLDRQYIPQMGTALLRCVFIFTTLTIWTPHVWYVGMAASIMTVINLAVNGYNTKVLTPELKISLPPHRIICTKKAIFELVGNGVWNSISSVGNMLLSGLDLVICNVTLGATAMGIVSLSKILPNYMQQLSGSIRNAFAPELTINFANENKEALLKDLNRAMKLTSIVMTIPIAIIVVLGDRFFELWVPTQDAELLQKLSILAILGYMFTSGTQILYNVFTTVNKVKDNAIAMLISGVVSTSMTLMMVKFTNYGIFAVAGVSTFVNLIRNMSFTVPATAKYLGFKWYQFFPQVGTTALSSVVIIGIGFVLKNFLKSGSWLSFAIGACMIGFLGLIFNIFIVLNKGERKFLYGIIMRKNRT